MFALLSRRLRRWLLIAVGVPLTAWLLERVGAALRAGIWKIAEPMPMRLVPAASQVSTVAASEPYASAAHSES